MPENNDIVQLRPRMVQEHEAVLLITYGGHNGELPDLVPRDSTLEALRAFATEAVRAGGVRNIPATPDADFTDFVADRFEPTPETPWARYILRPKTPFGLLCFT